MTLVQASDYTPGKPVPHNVVTAAESFQEVYGRVFNTELCNWIADNVAAAAGAPMPLPDQYLEPGLERRGRLLAHRLPRLRHRNPGHRLEHPGPARRYRPARVGHTGAGHTTTVLAVNEDGTARGL